MLKAASMTRNPTYLDGISPLPATTRTARLGGHPHDRNRGISLIEVLIAIAIVALLLVLGVPTLRDWIEDTKVRVPTESVRSGIQLARAEAIRLNELVRFQLTSDLTSSCALSSSASNWVVSLDDPTSLCHSDPAPLQTVLTAAAPRIIQSRPAAEAGGGFAITATGSGAAQTTLTFNGAGRLSGGNNIDTIHIPSASAQCQHLGGNLRCLRIRVLAGGDAIICDPKVTDANDIRICP